MEEIKLFSDCRGAHNGQVDMTVIAVTVEHVIGHLYYAIFGGELHIGTIRVVEEHRRQGVATKMLRQMETDSPGFTIQWGMTTNAGTKLKASYVASCDKKGN